MAALVEILEWNGTAGVETSTNKTSGTVRQKAADNSAVDLNNPLVKPSVGSFRSFEKWLRLFISTPGPTGSITNLQYYTDGVNNYGAGIFLFVRTTNPGAYATPTTPANDAAGTNAFTFTSVAAKSMDVANPGPFSGTNTSIGDYLVQWLTIDTTCAAPQSPTISEVITLSWDET